MKTLTKYLNEALILEYKNEYFQRKLNRRKKSPLTLEEIIDTIKDGDVQQSWLDAISFSMNVDNNSQTTFIEQKYPYEKNKNTFADLEEVAKKNPDYNLVMPLDGRDEDSPTRAVYHVVGCKINKWKHVEFSLCAIN